MCALCIVPHDTTRGKTVMHDHLHANLLRARANLGCNQLLQVANGVVLIALYAHLLAQTVIQNHFNHEPV